MIDPGFSALKDYVIRSTGLAYYEDKGAVLAGKISQRMQTSGRSDCGAYLALLRKDEAELDALVAELTIGETYFFRIEEQFEALKRSILPERIAANADIKRLRIWSAGCATGAEVYSLSILLEREFGADLAGWDVSIIGTDINKAFLARAGRARFGEWAMRGIDDATRRECFDPEQGEWLVRKRYRRGVTFQFHNLVRHPFPSLVQNLTGFDVVLCRNTMIYFSGEVVKACLARFREALVEGGWLIVGHAEGSPDLFHDYLSVPLPEAVAYRRWTQKGEMFSPQAPRARKLPVRFSESAWSPPKLPDVPASFVPVLAQEESAQRREKEEDPSALWSRVSALANEARWQDAEIVCRRMIEDDHLASSPHLFRGLVLDQMGRYDEAEASLDRAIYLDRACVLAHYHKGLLRQRNGDGPGAGRAFRNAIQVLENLDQEKTYPEADGISSRDLADLARMQLEVMGNV